MEEIDYSLLNENKEDPIKSLKDLIKKFNKDENISKFDRKLYSKLFNKIIKQLN